MAEVLEKFLQVVGPMLPCRGLHAALCGFGAPLRLGLPHDPVLALDRGPRSLGGQAAEGREVRRALLGMGGTSGSHDT